MSAIVEIQELGRRVRKLRLDQRMTLKQVEQSSGLSATHLSEIERGRTSPTIGALVRIARALGRDASFFIERDERDEVAHLHREQSRTAKLAKGVTATVLTRGIPGSQVFAYRLVFEPGSELGLPAEELDGDVLYFVHQGSFEARFGDQQVTLAKGDAAHATLGSAHVLRASNGEGAEATAVATRPLEEAR
jgi:transcriptional regulator with XRE-family HTH domain